jgi:hypothetical protein
MPEKNRMYHKQKTLLLGGLSHFATGWPVSRILFIPAKAGISCFSRKSPPLKAESLYHLSCPVITNRIQQPTRYVFPEGNQDEQPWKA